MLFEMLYEEQDFVVELLVANPLFRRRINKHVYDGLLNMWIGPLNNGRSCYEATKHGLMEEEE